MKIMIRPDLKRKQFSERLHKALENLGVPDRGRTAWLKKHWLLCTDEELSIAAFRKWLSGGAIPDPSRLDALAAITKTSAAHLLGLSNVVTTSEPDRLASTAMAIKTSPLDLKALCDVLEAVETELTGSATTISHAQKAVLIKTLYTHWSRSGCKGDLEVLTRVALTYIMCEQQLQGLSTETAASADKADCNQEKSAL